MLARQRRSENPVEMSRRGEEPPVRVQTAQKMPFIATPRAVGILRRGRRVNIASCNHIVEERQGSAAWRSSRGLAAFGQRALSFGQAVTFWRVPTFIKGCQPNESIAPFGGRHTRQQLTAGTARRV